MKPVLFVTGHAAPDRHPGFAELHDRQEIQLALFGGPDDHGAPGGRPPAGLPVRHVSQADVGRMVASGAYRAVIVGTGGRLALPAAWVAARRARLPFIFWAAIWRTPRTAAHLAGLPLMLWIYRDAAAVVTYGEHVSGYVAARGARNITIAPQAVDNDFWSAGAPRERLPGPLRVLFVGRPIPAKGRAVLCDAWVRSGLGQTGATLTLVGGKSPEIRVGGESPQTRVGGCESPEIYPGVVRVGQVDPTRLRNFYGLADVLAIPSIPTPAFVEPWGLVANEAMNQRTAIITTDAVGACAGGMLRDRRNAIVVPAGDPAALADALVLLARQPELTARLADAGTRDVRAFTQSAWADAFAAALESVGAGRDPLLACPNATD